MTTTSSSPSLPHVSHTTGRHLSALVRQEADLYSSRDEFFKKLSGGPLGRGGETPSFQGPGRPMSPPRDARDVAVAGEALVADWREMIATLIKRAGEYASARDLDVAKELCVRAEVISGDQSFPVPKEIRAAASACALRYSGVVHTCSSRHHSASTCFQEAVQTGCTDPILKSSCKASAALAGSSLVLKGHSEDVEGVTMLAKEAAKLLGELLCPDLIRSPSSSTSRRQRGSRPPSSRAPSTRPGSSSTFGTTSGRPTPRGSSSSLWKTMPAGGAVGEGQRKKKGISLAGTRPMARETIPVGSDFINGRCTPASNIAKGIRSESPSDTPLSSLPDINSGTGVRGAEGGDGSRTMRGRQTASPYAEIVSTRPSTASGHYNRRRPVRPFSAAGSGVKAALSKGSKGYRGNIRSGSQVSFAPSSDPHRPPVPSSETSNGLLMGSRSSGHLPRVGSGLLERRGSDPANSDSSALKPSHFLIHPAELRDELFTLVRRLRKMSCRNTSEYVSRILEESVRRYPKLFEMALEEVDSSSVNFSALPDLPPASTPSGASSGANSPRFFSEKEGGRPPGPADFMAAAFPTVFSVEGPPLPPVGHDSTETAHHLPGDPPNTFRRNGYLIRKPRRYPSPRAAAASAKGKHHQHLEEEGGRGEAPRPDQSLLKLLAEQEDAQLRHQHMTMAHHRKGAPLSQSLLPVGPQDSSDEDGGGIIADGQRQGGDHQMPRLIPSPSVLFAARGALTPTPSRGGSPALPRPVTAHSQAYDTSIPIDTRITRLAETATLRGASPHDVIRFQDPRAGGKGGDSSPVDSPVIPPLSATQDSLSSPVTPILEQNAEGGGLVMPPEFQRLLRGPEGNELSNSALDYYSYVHEDTLVARATAEAQYRQEKRFKAAAVTIQRAWRRHLREKDPDKAAVLASGSLLHSSSLAAFPSSSVTNIEYPSSQTALSEQKKDEDGEGSGPAAVVVNRLNSSVSSSSGHATLETSGLPGYPSLRRTRGGRIVEGRSVDEEERSAVVIQAWWRGHSARCHMRKEESAAVEIQRHVRGHLDRQHLNSQHNAATKFQALFRGHSARKKWGPLVQENKIVSRWICDIIVSRARALVESNRGPHGFGAQILTLEETNNPTPPGSQPPSSPAMYPHIIRRQNSFTSAPSTPKSTVE